VGTLITAIGAVAAGDGVGGVDDDEVPTYVLPGRCESVRNWV
jgi:hypothetical protein